MSFCEWEEADDLSEFQGSRPAPALVFQRLVLAPSTKQAYDFVSLAWGPRLRAQDSRSGLSAVHGHMLGALAILSASAGTSSARFRP